MSKQAKLNQAEILWGRNRKRFSKRNFYERSYYVLGEGLGIKLFHNEEEARQSFKNQEIAYRRMRKTDIVIPQAYGLLYVVHDQDVILGVVMDHIPSISLQTHHKVRYVYDGGIGTPKKRAFKVEIDMAKARLKLLERGVEHTDIHPNNVRMTKQKKIAVIDWDWANFK